MPRAFNPPQGYFCTANNDLNHWGIANPTNMPMGAYRAERIAALLEEQTDVTVESISKMHFDVYSRQMASSTGWASPLWHGAVY